ncbi:MAG TPA: hypothetical protein VJ023_06385 [Pyrinomonadaceae bacterium]|nr:hypothetical protein [Pyrinomonadaceae bacterium]
MQWSRETSTYIGEICNASETITVCLTLGSVLYGCASRNGTPSAAVCDIPASWSGYIRGLGISAALAESIGARGGPLLAGMIAFLGAWLLFKTQLDSVKGMTRAITDILWTGSRRFREWRGGDVRAVYYSVLAVVVLWGIIALRLAQPILLLQLGANVASIVLVIASVHLLYINTRLLPLELRPPRWRRVALVGMSLFYSFFVVLSLSTFL